MDLIIVVVHLLIAFFITSLPIIPSLLVVGYTVLWYVVIDRMVINFLLVIPTRFVFTNILRTKDGSIGVSGANLIIEMLKAPISIYLGGILLGHIVQDSKAIYVFAIGFILWLLPLYFFKGIFKNHPHKIIMFIGNILGVILGLFLLGKI